jgi:hypothetical protein
VGEQPRVAEGGRKVRQVAEVFGVAVRAEDDRGVAAELVDDAAELRQSLVKLRSPLLARDHGPGK